jgi:hypothetical protein
MNNESGLGRSKGRPTHAMQTPDELAIPDLTINERPPSFEPTDKTSSELVLYNYKASETTNKFPSTWKEYWRARHRDPMWTTYNKGLFLSAPKQYRILLIQSPENYKIMPCPTLASGESPADSSGCPLGVQFRLESDQPNIFNLEFTCFPKLPTELRLQIWEYAPPRLRVVQVAKFPTAVEYHFTCRLAPNNNFGLAHLLTCRECRRFSQSVYPGYD